MVPESVRRENVLLAPHTTMGLGGPARYFAVCRTTAVLCEHLAWARKKGLPVQILGGGSNTLFADQGFDGLVLKIELRGLAFAAQGEWVAVRAGAGEDWDDLVRLCVERGLGGIECLSGIPGLVGATPIQNVGAYGQEVRETLVRIAALDRQNFAAVEFAPEECDFNYRQSRFKGADKDRYIITQVSYRLRREGRAQLQYPELRRYVEECIEVEKLEQGRPVLSAVRAAVLQLRRRKSMGIDPADPNARSLGSFFLNPILSEGAFRTLERCWEKMGGRGSIPAFAVPEGIKIAAAWLVEQAGFAKGYSRGGAAISSRHALALINCGGSTREVRDLAGEIQQGVKARFDIWLEREPVVVC